MAAARLRMLVPDDGLPAEAQPNAAEALRLVRKAQLYRPAKVLELAGAAQAALGTRSVGYWEVMEQQAEAAANLGAWDTLRAACAAITRRFAPAVSSRAGLTRGLELEARCDWAAALRTYIEVLADDAGCRRAYKRQVAVLKAQRRLPEAAAALNHYLSYWATDAAAWAEACALALEAGRAAHACYAANELVLCDPNNHAAHTLVGDVLLTAGSVSDVVQARKHYAASVSARRKGNLRALYGLWYAAAVLDSVQAPSKTERARNSKVLVWARKAVKAEYQALPEPAVYSFVDEVVEEAVPTASR